MIRNKTPAGPIDGDSFSRAVTHSKVAGQFQSGRQAFLAKNYEAAADIFPTRWLGLNRTISSNPVCIAKEYGTMSAALSTIPASYRKRVSPWNESYQFIRMIIWPGSTSV